MENYSYIYEVEQGLVSVIIPTHNRANLLEETLKSFEIQTYNSIEIIIVDDHSTDNTRAIVDCCEKRSRFHYKYIRPEKRGSCHARNIGLINSRGEYVQFFDDDDVVDSYFIEKRINAINSGDYDFATCNFKYFDMNLQRQIREIRIDTVSHNITAHLYSNTLPTHCFLFKRNSIEKIGFWNEQILRLQDLAYFQRIFKYGLVGVWLEDSLYKVRVHNNNISHLDDITRINAFSHIISEWENTDKGKEVSLVCVRNMCAIVYVTLKNFEVIKGLKYLSHIVRLYPQEIVRYVMLCIFSPQRLRLLFVGQ